MDNWTRAGLAKAVQDGGPGLRFQLPVPGQDKPERAFIVRFEGQVFGYLNRCGHVPVELDWPEGQFFDDVSAVIVCASHGASYHPGTGACLGGPCDGRGLVRLEVRLLGEEVWARWPSDD
ncbi:MAG: Rieske (2Fe-2S) protein [Burkholderiaceae bacterium]